MPRIKLVAMSASALEHERERYLKAGCDDFVAKPFRAERIYRCLWNLLDVQFILKEKAERPIGTGYLHRSRTIGPLRGFSAPADDCSRIAQRDRASKVVCRRSNNSVHPGVRLAQHLRQFLASYDMKTIQRIVAQIPVLLGQLSRGTLAS